MNRSINRIKDLLNGGFFHILGSSFINKCIAFLSNIVLVRLLTKSDFGVFTNAFNIFFIVYLFSGFGITSGLLYFCSKNMAQEEKQKYYHFGLIFGLGTEIVLSIALVCYAFWGNVGIEETRIFLLALAGLPFAAYIFDFLSIILRAEKENKKYSLLLNIHSTLYAALAIVGAIMGGILGTIIGRYLSYIIAGVIGVKYCKPYYSFNNHSKLDPMQAKDLTKYSIKAGTTSALNVLLYRLDVAIIAIVVADASILASYKIGTTLPENLNFIPQCMMVYYVPLFVQNIENVEWIKRKTKEIYLFVGAVSLFLGGILLLFPKQIITILWGEMYLDAVPCMRILAVSFIILSTFRITSTNILLSLKRAGFTMIVSLVVGVVNIVLDVVLTISYGSIGAAYATLIVTLIAAVLSFPYVIYIIYSGKAAYE